MNNMKYKLLLYSYDKYKLGRYHTFFPRKKGKFPLRYKLQEFLPWEIFMQGTSLLLTHSVIIDISVMAKSIRYDSSSD